MYPMPGENAKPGTTFLISFTIAAPADLVYAREFVFVLVVLYGVYPGVPRSRWGRWPQYPNPSRPVSGFRQLWGLKGV